MRKEKKNYLVSLILTLALWAMLALMIVFIDPEIMANLNFVPFFVILFLAVLFSASLILADTTGGVIVAAGVVFWGILRVWRISNWFNTLLIVGIVLVILIYRWGKTKEVPDIS